MQERFFVRMKLNIRRNLLLPLAILLLGGQPAIVVAAEPASPAPPGVENSFFWDLGSPADLDAAQPAHVTTPDRVGPIGAESNVTYRLLKPGVYQASWTMPAFDFDAANEGAINGPFYLTIRFKDVAKDPVWVHTSKGGDGFYGSGFVGSFGGTGDGVWKEETVIIRRSMMRCRDGKTFGFLVNSVKGAIPIDWIHLWSAHAKLPDVQKRIAAALAAEAARRQAAKAALIGTFKDLGLPAPGPCPDYTPAEKDRGFRIFLPPINRQLFANSQPLEGELTNTCRKFACPGQFESISLAIRGLNELGKVSVTCGDLKGKTVVPLSKATIRWAVYSEQRIGSSWGKTYRVCPEQLAAARSLEVRPERLELAYLAFQVPRETPAGEYAGELTVSAEKGGKAVIPITLTVYPFRLEHPDHATHGQFYYMNWCDYSPFELQDMRDHGMDSMVAGLTPPVTSGPDGKAKIDEVGARKAFKRFQEMGFRSPLICDICRSSSAAANPAANSNNYTETIRQTIAIAGEYGFRDTGFFVLDEPHVSNTIARAKILLDWVKSVPEARSFVTTNPKAAEKLDPVLDYPCYSLGEMSTQTMAKIVGNKQTPMLYCTGFDVNPEPNRYISGFYFFKSGALSEHFFAYMAFAFDPFLDLDWGGRDWNVVYPSMDSPVHDPTVEWESMRAGVDDYRYLYTLKAMADRAGANGKTVAAGKARKVLDEVLAPVDTDGGKASGGPAVLEIEADVRLKGKQLTPEQIAGIKRQWTSGWYDQSRQQVAQAILDLQKATADNQP